MNRIYLLLVGLLTCLYVGAEDKLTLSTAGNSISIGLDNETSFTAFQMDVIIPQGLTKTAVTPASRIASSLFEVDSEMIESNVLRVIAHNTDNQAIDGNTGKLLTITLSSALKATDVVEVKNIRFVKSNNLSEKSLADVSSTSDFMRGDANDDGKIGTADIMYIVNKILGTPAEDFNALAADVNEDGQIGTADLMMVVQYILNGEFPSVANMAKAALRGSQEYVTLGIKPFGINAGESKSIELELSNVGFDASAFVCDLLLPDGLSVNPESVSLSTKSGRTSYRLHALPIAVQNDGAIRILCYSADGERLVGDNGAVVNIEVVASENISNGEMELFITNQEVTNADGTQSRYPTACRTKVTIGAATSVDMIETMNANNHTLFNATGIQLREMQKGINIVKEGNNSVKKVYVK